MLQPDQERSRVAQTVEQFRLRHGEAEADVPVQPEMVAGHDEQAGLVT